jgi:hypothetical protein
MALPARKIVTSAGDGAQPASGMAAGVITITTRDVGVAQ